jgi:G:T-mismatch repair DNA endonuclease (very short patch repair protein)
MQEEKETGLPELLQKQGLTFKTGDTTLEGQAYEFMTGHDTIVSMGDDLKEYVP